MSYEKDEYGEADTEVDTDLGITGVAVPFAVRQRIVKKIESRETPNEELARLLRENPIVYMKSPIHIRIEELKGITGKNVIYDNHARYNLLTDQFLTLTKNGRVRQQKPAPAPAPAPVLQLNKRKGNTLRLVPPAGETLFNVGENDGSKDDNGFN